jgi:hypothetical protein
MVCGSGAAVRTSGGSGTTVGVADVFGKGEQAEHLTGCFLRATNLRKKIYGTIFS